MSVTTMHKVLLIGCDSDVVKLMKIILTRWGNYEFAYTELGRQGIILAENEHPDLIIIQIMIADMIGYDVCAQLKQHRELNPVPVLLQAAIPSAKVYSRAQACGAAGYLKQPYTPQTLVTACEAALCGETYYPPL